MNASAAAQPTKDDAYGNPSNPTSHTPAESKSATQHSSLNNPKIFSRRPGDQPGIEPTPGARGTGSSHPDTLEDDAPPADTLDGEQMRPAAEGDVMKAQAQKSGTGEESSFTSDLDRKRDEQKAKRDEIEGQREQAVEEGGSLGQRGGPAVVEGR